jgi:hypothetical protein
LSGPQEKLDSNRYQIFEMPAWRAPLMIAAGEPPPVVEEVTNIQTFLAVMDRFLI